MPRLRWVALGLFALGAAVSAGTPVDVANFTETTYASGLGQITGLAWGSSGGVNYLFVATRTGSVRVVRNGALQSTPYASVSPINTTTNGECGLQSICVDPGFATNRRIYVFVTESGNGASGDIGSDGVQRIHRYDSTTDASGNLVGTGKTAIGPALPTRGMNHNGGGMSIGPDNNIYFGVGNLNNGVNRGGNSKTGETFTSLGSKVGRMSLSGAALSDNPYYNAADGIGAADYIYARGMRNPFGLRHHPVTGALWVTMVGDGYEQIFLVPRDGNAGWPTENNTSTTNGLLIPKLAYRTNASGSFGGCLTRGVFYGASAFPAAYQGNFFFCDYNSSQIMRSVVSGSTTITNTEVFLTGAQNPTDICVGPDGALYYAASAGGAVRRVAYTGGNVAPTITSQPANQTVNEGQSATFTAAASGNPTPSVRWQRSTDGGGSWSDIAGATSSSYSTGATTSSMNGYRYRMVATNTAGSAGSNPATLTVNGPTAATPVIVPGGGTYSGPVTVRMSTSSSGAEIRYTTDGSTPTASSTLYTGPFARSATTTVRAIARGAAYTTSAVASTTYTISGSTPYGLPYRETVSGITVPAQPSGLPTTLSGTGLFSNTGALTPRAGLVPFTVNSPLWSDGSSKKRWIALPGTSKIVHDDDSEWSFPAGTVFVKHFDLTVSPGVTRRLETRVLRTDGAGGGYGSTYRWRADGTDADLVTSAQTEDIQVNGKTQRWLYPSPSDCLRCHTPAGGFILGAKTRQLNGAHAYPGGVSDNQIRTWNYLEMFTARLDEGLIAGWPRLKDLDDVSATLEDRVKSYLDSNCAHCHRAGAPQGRANFDALYTTPMASQGLVDALPAADPLGLTDARLVAPGSAARSVLHERMERLDSYRMPTLASNVPDPDALVIFEAWIHSLPGGTPPPATSGGSGGGSCGALGLDALLLAWLLSRLRKR